MKFSIVTPSYNQGVFLERTLRSVLDQGWPELEYIVIDGGSNDESVEILERYQDQLAYWVSEPDRGQAHAVNKGLERATGDIIGWLNSDDLYRPSCLQAVADYFDAHPKCLVVYAQIGFPEARYQIHEGFIEDLIQHREGFPDQVSFAYVDFDFYEPILIALRFLDEVLVPGGSVMVDDYDFFSSGAKTAVTEFMDQANAQADRYTIQIADPKLGHFAVLTRTDMPSQG